MKMKILMLSLVLTLSTNIIFAELNKNTNLNNSNSSITKTFENKEFIKYNGQIKEIIKDKENIKSILVKTENDEIVFHINENVSILDMTNTKENKMIHLEEGVTVDVYAFTNTPTTMSIPAQMTPKAIVIKNDDSLSVKIDRFNEDLVSSDNQLALNIENQELKDLYKNKILAVYYDISTRSIPAQTNPKKIIIIDENTNSNMEGFHDIMKNEFIKISGKIKNINLKNNKISSIYVETGENLDYIFHINNSVNILDMTNTKENKMIHLEEGVMVDVYAFANTPTTMSIPAQMTPKAIVIKNDDSLSVKIDRFNEDLISSDNQLALNIENQELKDLYKNKILAVYYDISTRSIPAQTNPKKVIIIDEIVNINNIKNFDNFKINDNIINENILNINGSILLPLRDISNILGYNILWTSNNDYITIKNNSNTLKLKLNDENYYINENNYVLPLNPILYNEKTYIPLEFIKNAFNLSIETENGMLTIK